MPSKLGKTLILLIRSHCKICPLPTITILRVCTVGNGQLLQWDLVEKINILRSWDKKYVYSSHSERLRYKMSTMEVHTKAYKTMFTLPVVHFFLSRQTKTILREVNITFCFKSTFCGQMFSDLNIAFSHNKYGLFPLDCIKIVFWPRQYMKLCNNWNRRVRSDMVTWPRRHDYRGWRAATVNEWVVRSR